MQFMICFLVDPAKAESAPSHDVSEAEFNAVRGLYMDGLFRQIWVYADRSGAFIHAEADSLETVAEKISALPLVRAGVFQKPQIVALAPYFGFAPRS